MKIKNLIVFSCLLMLGAFTSGFIYPNTATIAEEKGEESFAKFLSHFEKIEMPYELNLKDLKKYENFQGSAMTRMAVKNLPSFSSQKRSPISRTKFIPEVARGAFKRMGPPEVEAIARFYPNKKSVAVIYKTLPRYAQNINENYRLMVYDLVGNVVFPMKNIKEKKSKKKRKKIFDVSESFALGHSMTQSTMIFKIDKEGRIWRSTYKNVWKDDLREKGIQDNELVNFDLEKSDVFKFDEDGFVLELNGISSEARASLD